MSLGNKSVWKMLRHCGNARNQRQELKRDDAVMSLGDNNIFKNALRQKGNAGNQKQSIKRGDAAMSVGDNNIWTVWFHSRNAGKQKH